MANNGELTSMPFIVSTSEEKPNDPETRKLIRSHVMLGKNRGKTRRYKDESLLGSRDGISAREKFEILSKSSCAPNFDRPPSWQSLIPFADSIGTQMLQDIVEFTSIAKKLLFPLEPCINFDKRDKSWFQPLFFDALYLHTLAFSSNAYFNLLLGRGSHNSGREPQLHFVKSLGLLRERLVADDERAISEVTFIVVLSLCSYAIMTNDLSSARTHLQGLHRLMCLRGGLSSINRPKLLVEAFRCDISLALSQDVEPLFFRDPFWEPLLPYPDDALFFPRSSGTSCLIPAMNSNQEDVDEELARAWALMKKFCLRISFAAETGSKVSVGTLLDTLASVMYRLLNLNFEMGSCNEAIRLGMLAFSSLVFLHPHSLRLSQHQLPKTYRICTSKFQVRGVLSARWVLWLLMVGVISGFVTADESWFTSLLQANLELSGIRSFSDLRHDLMSFLWIGHLHDRPAMNIFASTLPSRKA